MHHKVKSSEYGRVENHVLKLIVEVIQELGIRYGLNIGDTTFF
jgi:hypothetical protein